MFTENQLKVAIVALEEYIKNASPEETEAYKYAIEEFKAEIDRQQEPDTKEITFLLNFIGEDKEDTIIFKNKGEIVKYLNRYLNIKKERLFLSLQNPALVRACVKTTKKDKKTNTLRGAFKLVCNKVKIETYKK